MKVQLISSQPIQPIGAIGPVDGATIGRRQALRNIGLGVGAAWTLKGCSFLDDVDDIRDGFDALILAFIQSLQPVKLTIRLAEIFVDELEDIAFFVLENRRDNTARGNTLIRLIESTEIEEEVGRHVHYASIPPGRQNTYAIRSDIVPEQEGQFTLHLRTALDERSGRIGFV